MLPMLATQGSHVPTGPDWSHEVKWDGVRILTDVTGPDRARVRLTSRNDNDVTVAWPEVQAAPSGVGDLLVDGEIIALNDHGVPDFRTLQERMHVRNARAVARLVASVPATYMVFDLLRLEGRDLSAEPLRRRRELLVGLDLTGSAWQVPGTYDDGEMLLDATRQQGLEGIVSKRLSSRYLADQRSPHWLKFAHRYRLSYVVGGWRPQEGTTDRLAALLVGEPTPEGLMYRGRVGSGIGARAGRILSGLLAPLASQVSPFDDEVPRVDAAGTHWVQPVVVVDVDTHGQGYRRLRQPSYRGVRSDLDAERLGRDR
ncbi:MAG: non-homologous end-joining DNA ligase [Nocardioides sp.]|nr:non-homologous end-joining DNA ligase [Nocardioides sp.]